ncbi:hypothetical protein TNCV_1433611 [Trichonephila clavipes]|nr:hypothetical protein TNCV_1433611 [Trichonephila clavipes]
MSLEKMIPYNPIHRNEDHRQVPFFGGRSGHHLQERCTSIFLHDRRAIVFLKRASLPYTAGLQWYWARTRDKASHDPMPIPLGYRGHSPYIEIVDSAIVTRDVRLR